MKKVVLLIVLLGVIHTLYPKSKRVRYKKEQTTSVCVPHESIIRQAKNVQPKKSKLTKAPLPLCKCWLASKFGPRKLPNGKQGYHKGVDFAADIGTPIYSMGDGKVKEAVMHPMFGNMVVVDHGKVNGVPTQTRYAHMHKMMVNTCKQGNCNQRIKKGQIIGQVGKTGNVRGKRPEHLHVQVEQQQKKDKKMKKNQRPYVAVDPLPYILATDAVASIL